MRIRVWDALVRVLHWTLATAVATGLISGHWPPSHFDDWHHTAGYVAAAAVVLRLVWGIRGSRYARLSQFVRSPRQVLAYARAHGMMVTAYSPLARGKVADDPVIREIAEAHDASPAQVVLRWLIDQPMVSAIPKAGSEAHIRANLAALDIRLSDAERAKIDTLRGNGRMINPSFAPEWDAA